MKKSILFLSALDFKEKSIQVIRKTPEAYAKSGWDVHYVVARDLSRHSNYYYESVINVDAVNTYRFRWPLQCIRDFLSSRIPLLILTKFISFLIILKLAFIGAKILLSKKIDVVYGYEMHGVLAMNLLRLFGFTRKAKTVSRFQGTFLYEMLEARQYSRLLFNLDLMLALWLPSDLCIMTNDGTKGNRALEKIKSKNLQVLKFFTNGVERRLPEALGVTSIKESYLLTGIPTFLSVSRLVGWKRVDRCIDALHVLKTAYTFSNFKYLVVGEGQEKERLESLVKELQLSANVIFVGSVPNSEVKNYLEAADYFVSTYDSSNVGNPLLEAIQAGKIIFTLNNGDTGSWIKHRANGFIYDINDDLSQSMAKDMYEVIHNDALFASIKHNVHETAVSSLWSWESRFAAEVKAVEGLLA